MSVDWFVDSPLPPSQSRSAHPGGWRVTKIRSTGRILTVLGAKEFLFRGPGSSVRRIFVPGLELGRKRHERSDPHKGRESRRETIPGVTRGREGDRNLLSGLIRVWTVVRGYKKPGVLPCRNLGPDGRRTRSERGRVLFSTSHRQSGEGRNMELGVSCSSMDS